MQGEAVQPLLAVQQPGVAEQEPAAEEVELQDSQAEQLIALLQHPGINSQE
jgi:hypothetical protein